VSKAKTGYIQGLPAGKDACRMADRVHCVRLLCLSDTSPFQIWTQ